MLSAVMGESDGSSKAVLGSPAKKTKLEEETPEPNFEGRRIRVAERRK